MSAVPPIMIRGRWPGWEGPLQAQHSTLVNCRLEVCQPSRRLHILSRSQNTWISMTTGLHHSSNTGWWVLGTFTPYRRIPCEKPFWMLWKEALSSRCLFFGFFGFFFFWVRKINIHSFSSSFLSCNCSFIYAMTSKNPPKIRLSPVLGGDNLAGASCLLHAF